MRGIPMALAVCAVAVVAIGAPGPYYLHVVLLVCGVVPLAAAPPIMPRFEVLSERPQTEPPQLTPRAAPLATILKLGVAGIVGLLSGEAAVAVWADLFTGVPSIRARGLPGAAYLAIWSVAVSIVVGSLLGRGRSAAGVLLRITLIAACLVGHIRLWIVALH